MMFKNHTRQVNNLAILLFRLVDSATYKNESELVCKVAAELQRLIDASSVHPDLGRGLLEFANLKDDLVGDSSRTPDIETLVKRTKRSLATILGEKPRGVSRRSRAVKQHNLNLLRLTRAFCESMVHENDPERLQLHQNVALELAHLLNKSMEDKILHPDLGIALIIFATHKAEGSGESETMRTWVQDDLEDSERSLMFRNKLGEVITLAINLFDLIDAATTQAETKLLRRIAGELRPLLEATIIHPDLGVDLVEFADIKDDFVERPDSSELKEGMTAMRGHVLEILKDFR